MRTLFNPLTGKFELVPSDNFSYYQIPLTCTVCVPMYQQMNVHNELTVEGELNVIGEVVLV